MRDCLYVEACMYGRITLRAIMSAIINNIHECGMSHATMVLQGLAPHGTKSSACRRGVLLFGTLA